MHGGIEEASERKPSLPDATGAFLPTDIEGSARVWASARVKTGGRPRRPLPRPPLDPPRPVRKEHVVSAQIPIPEPGLRRRRARAMRRLGAATCGLCVLLAALALAPAHGSSDPGGASAGVVQIGGGRGIFMECQGTGSPTVVLISGKGNGAHDGWSEALGRRDPVLRKRYDLVALGKGKTLRERASAVFPSVSKFTRVCAYSRPGTGLDDKRGTSTPVAQPHPVEQDVADLHALLTAGDVAGPYVVVAHSYGGLIARLFASTYPDEVSGLVLEDVVNPFDRTVTSARRFANWDRLNSFSPDGKTEAVRVGDAIDAIEAAPPLRRMPIVQLSADKPWDPKTIRLQEKMFGKILTFAQWQRAQRLQARSLHATAIWKTRSGHNIEVYRPALVTRAIRRVVDAVREGRDSVPPFRPGRAARARVIRWTACGTGLDCARVRVPLDWARPAGRKISLAVIRRRASRPEQRIGTLFFNPGGPGSSGVDVIKDAFSAGLLDEAADGRFDIVSWDPRGVGASTRVRCFRSQGAEARFWGATTIPTTTAASRRYAAKARAYARRCGRVSGGLLRHISTADTVRDLDHLRRLVGEPKLTYIGWSYGTFLGQTYANTYPKRVRAMVLDGVVDAPRYVRGRESSVDNVITPADPVFEKFIELCQAAGPPHVRADGKTAGCALAGADPVKERVEQLLRAVRARPIPAPSADPAGPLTYSKLLTSMFPMLRNPGGWPEWARNLDAAARGDGSALADIANANPPGAGGAPAPVSIGCADSPARQPLGTWRTVIGRLTRTSAIAGPVLGWWLWAPCAAWPARSAERYTGPWNAKTRNPVLVIGTRYDPNTSYPNARATAKRLGNAVLLTHDGYGHISFVDPSRCVMAAYRRYLTALEPPVRGTVCPSDRGPFDPDFGEPVPEARAQVPKPREPKLTPVIEHVLSTPRWYVGDDRRVHLEYELRLTNALPIPVDVRALRVLDGRRHTVARLTDARLQAATSLVGTPEEPATTLPASSAGIVWVDLEFARRADVPKRVEHRLTVDIGPDHPELGRLLTDNGAPARVARRGPAVLSPPLSGGRWVGIVGPHRRAIYPIANKLRVGQRFAVDFSARLDRQGRTHDGDPARNASYFNYLQPVLAVGDGVVVTAVDGLPNQIPNNKVPVPVSQNDGNHVIIRLRDGSFAAYAHLAPGSIRVRRGQRVRSGQVIGRLGNSGNSGGPHLHFQLMNRPSLIVADGLPFVLDRFRFDGRVPSLEAFIEADADPAAPPVPYARARDTDRRRQGFTSLEVVTFPALNPGGA